MNFNWENWNFDTQSFNWLLALVCIIIGLFFSFKTWKRADKKRLVGFWEIFRIFILFIFCFTLFAPQRIEIVRSEIKPQILFLFDESACRCHLVSRGEVSSWVARWMSMCSCPSIRMRMGDVPPFSDEQFSKSLWMCEECESQVDSMSHVDVCPAYQPLREGKDLKSDKDLADYMAAVMSIRSKLNFFKQ